MPELPPQPGQPDADEVLAAVSEDLNGEIANLGRLEIFQATPQQYAYRAYVPGGDDYYGGVITVEPA